MTDAVLVDIVGKSFISIFHLLLLSILVCKICTTVINAQKTNTIIRIFIVYLVCIFISYSLAALRISLYGKYPFGNINSVIFYVIRAVFETFGFCTWYSMVLYQVKSVFMGSQFEIKQRIVWMHRCFVLLMIIFALITFFCIMLQRNDLAGISIAGAALAYMSGYYHLIFLFNSRLYKMVKAQSNSQNISEQSPILNIMRRSAVLMSIHALWFTIQLVVTIITGLYWNEGLSLIIFAGCSTFVSCYNGLCLFLMLRINENYYQCLCQICDARFEVLCNQITRKVGAELQLAQMHSNSSVPQKQSIPV